MSADKQPSALLPAGTPGSAASDEVVTQPDTCRCGRGPIVGAVHAFIGGRIVLTRIGHSGHLFAEDYRCVDCLVDAVYEVMPV